MPQDGKSEDDLKALEREVGDLLAQAELLSEELVTEVGADESRPPSSPRIPAASESADEIDQRIADTDAALGDAVKELGAEAPQLPPKKATRASLPPKSLKPAADPAPPRPEAAASAPQRTSNRLKLPPKPATATSLPADRLVSAKVDAPVVMSLPPTGTREALGASTALARLAHTWDRTAQSAAGLLEVIDRPFHRISYSARMTLGWIALAMFSAAIALYLFAVR